MGVLVVDVAVLEVLEVLEVVEFARNQAKLSVTLATRMDSPHLSLFRAQIAAWIVASTCMFPVLVLPRDAVATIVENLAISSLSARPHLLLSLIALHELLFLLVLLLALVDVTVASSEPYDAWTISSVSFLGMRIWKSRKMS